MEDIVIYHCFVLLTGLLTISSTVFFYFFLFKISSTVFSFFTIALSCPLVYLQYLCTYLQYLCTYWMYIMCLSQYLCTYWIYIMCLSQYLCTCWIYIMCLSYQDLLCVPISCVSPIKSTLDIYYVSLLSRPGCRPWQVPNNTVFLFFPPFFSSFFFLCQSPVHAL